MKIAINLLFLRPGKVGGSEVFSRNLVESLLRIDKKNDYILLVSENTKNELVFNRKTEYLVCNFNNRSILKRVLFEQFVLPVTLRKKKIDLLINLGNTALLFSALKQVLVVHDLMYFVFPEYFSFLKRNYLRIMVWLSCRKAGRIATVSTHTKKDLVKFVKTDFKKITVIYAGVDEEKFSKAQQPAKVDHSDWHTFGRGDYVYSPTSIYPHKNNFSLIQAFAKLKKEREIIHKLIITGVDPYNKKEALAGEIKQLEMENDIFYLGSVPFDHVPPIYHNAAVVVYLSEYEGFGLPVLEAMAAEVPVLCSDRSSLPEVVGNAGVLADPHDIHDIAGKLHALLTDTALRNQCITYGIKQVKRFSWEKTARKMIDTCYEL